MRWFWLLIVSLIIVGCAQQQATPTPPDFPEYARVKVTADGQIFMNGNPAAIEDLEVEFARLATVGGGVWYYRENPEAEPHPIAEEVLNAIIAAQLPIAFSEVDFG